MSPLAGDEQKAAAPSGNVDGSPTRVTAAIPSRGIGILIDQTFEMLSRPSETQRRLLDQLRELSTRLKSARLQVAVVGQFKRGKSSLLNALLGFPLLPVGVVPLTAIATVLLHGAPKLDLFFLDGHVEEKNFNTRSVSSTPETDAMAASFSFHSNSMEALRKALDALVSEEKNPGNRLGLRRVVVHAPATLLSRGVALIDTPGIGSTLRHNTEAAIAALPECDVALFVMSPDPPMTTLEMEYLSRVRASAARIIVVLNKCDLQEPAELARSIAYLRQLLVEQAGLDQTPPIFPVSARAALRALEVSEDSEFAMSGVPELQQALMELVDRQGSAVLAEALSRKSADVIGALHLEAEISAQAWRLSLAELDQRIGVFEAGLSELTSERAEAEDRIATDKKRLFAMIDKRAAALADETRRGIEPATVLRSNKDLTQARQQIAALVVNYFSKGSVAVTATIQGEMVLALQRHQRRIGEMIDSIRRQAGSLMGVNVDTVVAANGVESPTLKAWIGDGRVETIAGLMGGVMEPFLPARLRYARWERLLREEAEVIMTRNTEALRWSLRRGVEEAVRHFIADLDDELSYATDAIRNAMLEVRTRRSESSGTMENAALAQERITEELKRIELSLRTAMHQ